MPFGADAPEVYCNNCPFWKMQKKIYISVYVCMYIHILTFSTVWGCMTAYEAFSTTNYNPKILIF